jgi:myo-inositol-1(or 4)-monophosphatase
MGSRTVAQTPDPPLAEALGDSMDLNFIKELAVEAGRIGMRHFGRVERRFKSDRTIVTEADIEIDRFVVERLRSRYPRHGVLAEETSQTLDGSADHVWAVDPIDGTQAFSAGLPTWAVSIGFLDHGVPTCGAIYLPVIGDLYWAGPGEAHLNERSLDPLRDEPLDENSYMAVPESIHHSYVYEWVGDLLSVGSVAAHCAYVARGSAVGTVCRPYIWDLAAGVAIMNAVGVQTLYRDGSAIDWTELYDGSRLRQAIIAARPSHWDAISRSFRRKQAD